jgi:hypothetical protein
MTGNAFVQCAIHYLNVKLFHEGLVIEKYVGCLKHIRYTYVTFISH